MNPIKNKNQVHCKDGFFLATTSAALIGFIIIICGFIFYPAHTGFFVWLVFYLPILWVLWISCVFLSRKYAHKLKLLALWLLINSTILLFYIYLSLDVDNWTNSQGVEVVIMMTYLPVGFPLVIFFPQVFSMDSLIVFEKSVSFFGATKSGVFALWLQCSTIAAIQSFAIFAASRIRF